MAGIKVSEELPIIAEHDVVVVGGGPAGASAAIAAARMGADSLVVEQFNCLGGVATAGGHGHVCLFSSWHSDELVVNGIPYEMVRRVTDAGYGVHDASYADFEVEGLKLVLEQMAEEAGLAILYHTFFCDVVREGDRIAGIVIQNKDGRSVIRARQVIDATGDGDVAWKAGCGYDYGNPEGEVQPVTLMFTVGGVDWDRVRRFRTEEYVAAHPDEERPGQLRSVWRQAQEAGDMRPYQSVIMGWWWTPTRPDWVGVNFTHVNHIDSRKAADLTRATTEARKQAYETIDVYRKYIPGMESCYMVSTPNTVGVRESRRIHTDHILTRDEVVEQATFPDSIGYGSFYIDIHNTSGPGMDPRTYYPPDGFKYQIPWRICRARGVSNLQVAGRCAGADHEALGSLRVMPQCGVMGQAAGVAAALAVRLGCALREVPVEALQDELRGQACILDEDDIRRFR